MKKLLILLTFVSLGFLYAQNIPEPPAVTKAESDLKSNWSKKYPDETILSVENGGDPVVLEKKDSKGKIVERKYKFPFKVTISKSGSKKIFEAGANYIQKGNSWVFSEIGVGQVTNVAESGDNLPAKPKVKEMILDVLKKKNPENSYSDLKIDDGELGKSGSRVWYRIQGNYKQTDPDGKAVPCKDADFTAKKAGSGWEIDISSVGSCY